jgi:alpha-tubulin suppressor-like RCC1 family protein
MANRKEELNKRIFFYAGGKHTVGLKSDGTALAVGDNSYGQCNVSGRNLN